MFSPQRVLRFLGRLLRLAAPFLLTILALSFVTEWFTWPDPEASPLLELRFWLGVLVNLIPAILAAYLLFWLAGRFVRDLYQVDGVGAAIGFLVRSRFGLPGFGPWMQIRESQIARNEESSLTRTGGPGHLVLYNDTAVVLERAGKFTKIAGPGFPKLEAFERIYEMVDLRPQLWQYKVSAMTKEGIPISWDAEVHYQIHDGGKEPTEKEPYPFSEDAVFRASTSRWVFVGRNIQMDWEGRIIISATEGNLRTILARWHLDDLVGLTRDNTEAARRVIERELEEKLREAAHALGAKILFVKLDNPQVEDPITQQWIKVWQARWQSWSTEKLAEGEAQRIYWYETAKASAQMSLIVRIARAFQELAAGETITPRVVLMRLFSVLDKADFAASSRIFFPGEALTALDNMKKLLATPGQFEIQLTPDSRTILVGENSSQVTAEVKDRMGRVASDGTLVRFDTSRGTISPGNVATYQGRAKAMLVAGTVAGDALVTASVDGSSAQVVVQILPTDPADIKMTAEPDQIAPEGDRAGISARVTDRYGNPVRNGTEVTFETNLGRLSSLQVSTQGGSVQTMLTSGKEEGIATVKAFIGNILGSVKVQIG